VAAGVLAGGRGRRWGGKRKELLEVAPGVSVIQRVLIELYRAGMEEIIILANNPRPYRLLGVQVMPDLRPHAGPLAGIETALHYYTDRFEATLFLPCDLPAITAREIRILLQEFYRRKLPVAVAATFDQGWEPLCAVVDNRSLPQISLALRRGERKPRAVWKLLGCSLVNFPDPKPFFNLNNPQDWERWLLQERYPTRRPDGGPYLAWAAG